MGIKNLDFEKLLEESVNQLNEHTQGNANNVQVITYKLNDLPEIDMETIKELRNCCAECYRFESCHLY